MQAHWFDDIKEVIFEWNTIMPAGTAISWGNNIDNYSGRYAQHVFHAYNNFNTEWGGDREFMTFDPVLGSYHGAAAVTAADPLTLQLIFNDSQRANGSASFGDLGGCVSVLAGTVRRAPCTSSPHSPTNHTTVCFHIIGNLETTHD